MNEDSANMPAYIYVLIDPRTSEVRYAGRTEDPLARFQAHLWSGKNPDDTSPKALWVRDLRDEGLRPAFKIVKDTTRAEANEDERAIILSLTANGASLTNGVGAGGGKVRSAQERARISRAVGTSRNWGGSRGGGRQPLSPLGKAKKACFTLSPEDAIYVLEQGNGSMTAGIRRIVAEVRAADEPQ